LIYKSSGPVIDQVNTSPIFIYQVDFSIGGISLELNIVEEWGVSGIGVNLSFNDRL